MREWGRCPPLITPALAPSSSVVLKSGSELARSTVKKEPLLDALPPSLSLSLSLSLPPLRSILFSRGLKLISDEVQ